MTTGDRYGCPECGNLSYYQMMDSAGQSHTVCIQCQQKYVPYYFMECPSPYGDDRTVFLPFNQIVAQPEVVSRNWVFWMAVIATAVGMVAGIVIGYYI